MLSCLWFKKNIYWLKRSKIFGNYKNLRSFYTYISFSNKYFNHKKNCKMKNELVHFQHRNSDMYYSVRKNLINFAVSKSFVK